VVQHIAEGDMLGVSDIYSFLEMKPCYSCCQVCDVMSWSFNAYRLWRTLHENCGCLSNSCLTWPIL